MKRLQRELETGLPKPGSESLRVHLCGGLKIVDSADNPVNLSSARGRAIIAYLCLAQDGRALRRELAEMLWDEPATAESRNTDETSDEAKPSSKDPRLGNLREELKKLKAELGALSDVLIVDRVAIRINLAKAWTDTRAYLLSIVAGEAPPPFICNGSRLLLRGQPRFETEFDDWLDDQREQFKETRRYVLAARAARSEQLKLPLVQKIAEQRKLFDFDHSDEEACRKLMTLLLSGGHYASARETYLRCAKSVLRDAACEPEPATRKLYDQALDCLKQAAASDEIGDDDLDVTGPSPERSRFVLSGAPLSRHDEHILVGLRPVANRTGDPALDGLANLMFEELKIDLPLLMQPYGVVVLPPAGLPWESNGRDYRYFIEVSLWGNPADLEQTLQLKLQVAACDSGRLVRPGRTNYDAASALSDATLLSSRIAGKIYVALLSDTSDQLRSVPSEAMSESELVLLGMSRLARTNTPQNVAEAELYFRSARKRNRHNVDALAGLAHVHHRMASQPSFSTSPQAALMRGRAYATEALALDANHAKANYVFAMLCSVEGRPEQAASIFDRLLATTSLASALSYRGYNKIFIGKAGSGRDDIRRSMNGLRDDSSLPIWLMFEGTSAFHCGDVEQAIELYQNSLDIDPRYGSSSVMLAGALRIAGRQTEAKAQMEAFRSRHPTFSMRDLEATWGNKRSRNEAYLTRHREMADALVALELPQA